MKTLLSVLLLNFLVADIASAHDGRTNSAGCHNNRKTGGYHCHREKRSTSSYKPVKKIKPYRSGKSYKPSSYYSNSPGMESYSLPPDYVEETEQYPEQDRELVRETQRLLNILGYKTGPEDGIMGKKTSSAIKRFELDKLIPISGLPSEELLVVLRSQVARHVAKGG